MYMYSISSGLYTCTVYHMVYTHVHDITWFIYMYSISPDLYTCTVYHLVYIHVQYIIWFIYMYRQHSISYIFSLSQ